MFLLLMRFTKVALGALTLFGNISCGQRSLDSLNVGKSSQKSNSFGSSGNEAAVGSKQDLAAERMARAAARQERMAAGKKQANASGSTCPTCKGGNCPGCRGGNCPGCKGGNCPTCGGR